MIVAGGGAAGFNIMPIARELGCSTVIVPRTASVLSACGMQYSDIVFEATRSRFTDSTRFDSRRRRRRTRCDRTRTGGFPKRAHRPAGRAVTCRAVRGGALSRAGLGTRHETASRAEHPIRTGLAEAFHQVHERVYAVRDEASPVEFVNWKGRIAVQAFPRCRRPIRAWPPMCQRRTSTGTAISWKPTAQQHRCSAASGCDPVPVLQVRR